MNPKKEMIADLKRSGLLRKDAALMKLSMVTPNQAKKLSGHAAPAYRIPYFDIGGRAIKFYRLRYLAAPSTFGKQLRYSQPPDTLPKFYFPRQMVWKKVVSNVELPLFITEGEKKAACACKHGIPTIGLGGVWAWRSKKRGNNPALEDFDLVTWQGRSVYVVFDSDITDKPEVMQAMEALCNHLLKLGAKPHITKLPAREDEKVGLDDYLVKHGAKGFLKLPTEDFAVSTELWKLNRELAVIASVASVYCLKTESLLSGSSLVETVMADRRIWIGPHDKKKEVNAVAEWLKWPQRRSYSALTYCPGQSAVVEGNKLNVWKGWGCQPDSKMGISPWNEFMDYVFDGEKLARRWFEQWLACPLQRPGTKMFTASLFWSHYEGVGKSFVGEIMKRIYGTNYAVISQEELHGDYTHWAQNKQFVMGEEIAGVDKRSDAEHLRYMLTRDSITINIKYQPQYSVPDCINYYFTSNNPNALFMGDTDRRMFIHEIRNKPLPHKFYTKSLDPWTKNGGPAGLLHHLLHVDLAGFDHRAPAMETTAKREMTELTRGDLSWKATELYRHPDNVLSMSGVGARRDLWTLEELITALFDSGTYRFSNASLSVALRRAGFAYPRVITSMEGKSHRLWVVRNHEKWAKADHSELVKHYEQASALMRSADVQGKVVPINRKKGAK